MKYKDDLKKARELNLKYTEMYQECPEGSSHNDQCAELHENIDRCFDDIEDSVKSLEDKVKGLEEIIVNKLRYIISLKNTLTGLEIEKDEQIKKLEKERDEWEHNYQCEAQENHELKEENKELKVIYTACHNANKLYEKTHIPRKDVIGIIKEICTPVCLESDKLIQQIKHIQSLLK